MPYRIPSPPEPDAPEEEPYAEVLRRQRRRARIVSAVVLLSCGAGVLATARVAASQPVPTRPRISENERVDAAHRAAESVRRRAAEQQERFAANMRDAVLSNVSPSAEAAACPVQFARDEAVKGMTTARRFPLLVVRESELADALPSQVVADVLADATRAEKHIAAGHFEEATLYARALDRADRFGVEVVLVTKESQEAHVLSTGAFSPGLLRGRAYLYEFASGRVVCAADVEAKTSKSIGYVYSDHNDAPTWLGPRASLDSAIDADLRHNTESAIIAAMRVVVVP